MKVRRTFEVSMACRIAWNWGCLEGRRIDLFRVYYLALSVFVNLYTPLTKLLYR